MALVGRRKGSRDPNAHYKMDNKSQQEGCRREVDFPWIRTRAIILMTRPPSTRSYVVTCSVLTSPKIHNIDRSLVPRRSTNQTSELCTSAKIVRRQWYPPFFRRRWYARRDLLCHDDGRKGFALPFDPTEQLYAYHSTSSFSLQQPSQFGIAATQ